MRDQVILDNLSTGVLALDQEMRVTAVNVAAQVMLETSEARCLGIYADKLLPYSSQLLDTFERALASRSPQATRSLSLMLLSGQELHVDLIVSSMGAVFPNNDRIGTIYILENDGRQNFTVRPVLENTSRPVDARAQVLAVRAADRQRLRRPEPGVRLPAGGGVR